jgi:hypothetical protein
MTKADDNNTTLAADHPIRHRYGNIIKAPRAGLKTRTALIVHQRGITKKQLEKFYCLHGKRFDYFAFAKEQNINLDWFTFGILALHPRIPAPPLKRQRAAQ